MLKLRIITALILMPLTLAALFYLPPYLFCILTGAITLIAATEWANLMELKTISRRFIYLAIVVALALFCARYILFPVILTVTFVWWLIAAVLVICYPRGSGWWGKSIILRGLMGLLVLVPCWVAINYIFIQEEGRLALLYLFVLIWGADSAAYFVGKKWGKNKLAPLVSPGKSIQGLFGALVFTVLLAVITQVLCRIPMERWHWGIGLSLLTVLFSILGDLFESMLKRNAGLKDSGNILPGHGGLLDRIDSLTAAAPVFAFGSWVLGTYLT